MRYIYISYIISYTRYIIYNSTQSNICRLYIDWDGLAAVPSGQKHTQMEVSTWMLQSGTWRNDMSTWKGECFCESAEINVVSAGIYMNGLDINLGDPNVVLLQPMVE